MRPELLANYNSAVFRWLAGDFDSPLEAMMDWRLRGLLAPGVPVVSQYPVDTFCGRFVLDFAILSPHPKEVIGIECDGAEFHDAQRDYWRDAMLMGSRRVNFMYRFSGSQIWRERGGLLLALAKAHPHLFTARTLHMLGVSPFQREFPEWVRAGDNRAGLPRHGIREHNFAKRGGFTRLENAMAAWHEKVAA